MADITQDPNFKMFADAISIAMPNADSVKLNAMWDGLKKQGIQLDATTIPLLAQTIKEGVARSTGTSPQNLPAMNVPKSIVNPEQAGQASSELSKIQANQANNNFNDPEALKAAYAQHAENLRQQQISGAAGNAFAGMTDVLRPGAGASVRQNAYNDRNAEISNLQTVAPIKALAEQYKAGEEAATSIVNRMNTVGKFEIEASEAALKQKKMQAELVPILQNADLARELNNPASPQSVAARELVRAQMKQTGLYNDAQINALVPDSMSAVGVNPIQAQVGVTMDQVGKRAEIILKGGQTEQARGLASQARASAGKIGAETPGAAADSALAQARNASIIGPDGKLVLPPGQAMSVSSGGVTIGNSPGTTASQTEVAGDQATTRKQATHYATSLQGPADKLLAVVQANVGTGLGAKLPASWSNTQSDAAQKAVNKIVAEEAAMNGVPFSQATADTLFKGGPKVVADYVLNLKAEQARRSAKLAMQEQYQRANNGTLQGFDPSPLTAMKPLYNPVTREVQLMTPGTKAWDNAIADKWVPSENGYYMGKK